MSSVDVGSAFSAYNSNNFSFFSSTDSTIDLPCEEITEEVPSESPLRRAHANLIVLIPEQEETLMQKALKAIQFPQQNNSLTAKWIWLEQNRANKNCSVYRYPRRSSATLADKVLKEKLPVPKTFAIDGKQMMSVVSSPTLDSTIVTEQVVPVTE